MTAWHRTWRVDPRARELADRHYSRQTTGHPEFLGPGANVVLVAAAPDEPAARALWATRVQIADARHHGLGDVWECPIFRNEGAGLASELILDALAITRGAWGDPPPGGVVTWVDPGSVRRKRDPGRCFRRAGFEPEGVNPKGYVVLRLQPDRVPEAIGPASDDAWRLRYLGQLGLAA